MTSASVCGSLREHIFGTTRPIFANFCACGSVLLWWRCDTSDTSRFMGDVIFARNGLCGNMSIPLQRVTSFHGRAQANVPAALYWLHRVLDDGAHRDSLDESIVQGIPGWSLQCTIALLFLVASRELRTEPLRVVYVTAAGGRTERCAAWRRFGVQLSTMDIA